MTTEIKLSNLKENDKVYLRVISHSNLMRHSDRCALMETLSEEKLRGMVHPGTVVKNGRKYITVRLNAHCEYQFDRNTGREHTQYSPDYILFPSFESAMSDIKSEILCQMIKKQVQKVCSYSYGHYGSGTKQLPLEDLMQIAKLLRVDLGE